MLQIIEENYQQQKLRLPIYKHYYYYREIIDINMRLLEIIGDLKESSVAILLSKLPGKLS